MSSCSQLDFYLDPQKWQIVSTDYLAGQSAKALVWTSDVKGGNISHVMKQSKNYVIHGNQKKKKKDKAIGANWWFCVL